MVTLIFSKLSFLIDFCSAFVHLCSSCGAMESIRRKAVWFLFRSLNQHIAYEVLLDPCFTWIKDSFKLTRIRCYVILYETWHASYCDCILPLLFVYWMLVLFLVGSTGRRDQVRGSCWSYLKCLRWAEFRSHRGHFRQDDHYLGYHYCCLVFIDISRYLLLAS